APSSRNTSTTWRSRPTKLLSSAGKLWGGPRRRSCCVPAQIIQRNCHELRVAHRKVATFPASECVRWRPEYSAQLSLGQVQRLSAFSQFGRSHDRILRLATIRCV